MRHYDISLENVVSAVRVVILRARFRGRIELGFDTHVGPRCRIIVAEGATVRLRGAILSRSVTLEASSGAVLEIGQTFLGQGSVISARDRVTIGDGSGIAEYVTIRDHDHLLDPDNPLLEWRYRSAPIIIKNDVWIASKATVVAGVVIEDHALCGANSVVTHDVQAWERVGGVPARPLSSSRKQFISVDGG
jgi:acetyltransferase-like isoleucine patch superfamily enzyme